MAADLNSNVVHSAANEERENEDPTPTVPRQVSLIIQQGAMVQLLVSQSEDGQTATLLRGVEEDISTEVVYHVNSRHSETPLYKNMGNWDKQLMHSTVTIWKVTYFTRKAEALRCFLELMLNTGGIMIRLVQEEVDRLLGKTSGNLTEWMDLQSKDQDELPPIWSHPHRTNLVTFMTYVFRNHVLRDIDFVRKVKFLLGEMTHSKWSSVRFTGFVVGSTLVRQYSSMYTALDVTITARVPLFLQEQEHELALQMINELMELVQFSYRDVHEDIRKSLFTSCMDWFEKWPDIFVTDKYLLYIYMALFDSCGKIRVEAIKAICKLVEADSNEGKLDLFIEKTTPHLFKRINDEQISVAKEALKALACIKRKYTTENLYWAPEKIYLLLFCDQIALATEAARFLYEEQMSEYHDDPVAFIKEIVLFVYESQMANGTDEEEDEMFVRSMLPHAEHLLADWVAWINVLLSEDSRKSLQEKGCQLLLLTIKQCATPKDSVLRFPRMPKIFETTVRLVGKERKAQHKLVRNQAELTKHFGSQLYRLLLKYKRRPKSLLPLLTIPQHFGFCVDRINVRSLCVILIRMVRNEIVKLDCKEAIMHSLAVLYHLMIPVARWRSDIAKLKKKMWDFTEQDFAYSCVAVALPRKSRKLEQKKGKDVLAKALLLTKYFDMTATLIPGLSLEALKLGKAKNCSEVVCKAAYMCLYQAQWEMTNIHERKYEGDELDERLRQLRTHLFTMNNELETLIMSTNGAIRDTAFSVLCRLLLTFCPANPYGGLYSALHLPPPSLITTEWLSFILQTKAPASQPPKDGLCYLVACETIKKFLHLLLFGVLHITYISSLLPLFQCYKMESNYNEALEDLSMLVGVKEFVPHLVTAFAHFLPRRPVAEVKMMADGFCKVVLQSMKPSCDIDMEVLLIVWTAVKHVREHKDLSVLQVFCPFVRLLTNNYARHLQDVVMKMFRDHLDSPFVVNFVAAFVDTCDDGSDLEED